jgi:hypothetical protein
MKMSRALLRPFIWSKTNIALSSRFPGANQLWQAHIDMRKLTLFKAKAAALVSWRTSSNYWEL